MLNMNPAPLVDRETVLEGLDERLNELITVCYDGIFGYETAAEAAETEKNRVMLQAYAGQRREFAAKLSNFVIKHGGEPAESGRIAGELHQAWIGLRSALADGDSAILAECARGDRYAVSKYEEALTFDMPEEVSREVKKQLSEIRVVQDKMETLASLTK